MDFALFILSIHVQSSNTSASNLFNVPGRRLTTDYGKNWELGIGKNTDYLSARRTQTGTDETDREKRC